MKGKNFKHIAFIAALTLSCLLLLPCCRRKPVFVGYVASLTGNFSSLSISGRNGAMLAEEAVNEAGGIRHLGRRRPLELLIRDDKHDKNEAARVNQELIDLGVKAVIGHITSDMTLAVLPLMNRAGVLLVSPTASATELTGRDDMLIMLNTANSKPAFGLGRYAVEQLGCVYIGVLCTTDNAPYADSYLEGFSDGFSESGGDAALVDVAYYSHKDEDFSYSRIVNQLLVTKPDCILIIDSPLNSALFCQNIRKAGYASPLLISGWAMTADFIANAGNAAEGVYFSQQYNPDHPSPQFKTFKETYKRRFGSEPSFASLFSYEAVMLAAEALSVNTGTPVKDLITTKGNFEGLQETFNIDRFGDIDRSAFVGIVENGVFKVITE